MNTAESIANLRQRMAWEQDRGSPPADFPPFPPLSPGRYTSQEFFDLEREHLWSKVWLYAGHRSQLPEPGSYLLLDIPGAPIFRDPRPRRRDPRVLQRLLASWCAARARAVSGTQRSFRCTYHQWTYDTDGSAARGDGRAGLPRAVRQVAASACGRSVASCGAAGSSSTRIPRAAAARLARHARRTSSSSSASTRLRPAAIKSLRGRVQLEAHDGRLPGGVPHQGHPPEDGRRGARSSGCGDGAAAERAHPHDVPHDGAVLLVDASDMPPIPLGEIATELPRLAQRVPQRHHAHRWQCPPVPHVLAGLADAHPHRRRALRLDWGDGRAAGRLGQASRPSGTS